VGDLGHTARAATELALDGIEVGDLDVAVAGGGRCGRTGGVAHAELTSRGLRDAGVAVGDDEVTWDG
jgi:hypothetical protein